MSKTVEEFLANGGEITKCEPGSKTTTTAREFLKRDRRLQSLREMLKLVKGDEAAEAKIEAAIQERTNVLVKVG